MLAGISTSANIAQKRLIWRQREDNSNDYYPATHSYTHDTSNQWHWEQGPEQKQTLIICLISSKTMQLQTGTASVQEPKHKCNNWWWFYNQSIGMPSLASDFNSTNVTFSPWNHSNFNIFKFKKQMNDFCQNLVNSAVTNNGSDKIFKYYCYSDRHYFYELSMLNF